MNAADAPAPFAKEWVDHASGLKRAVAAVEASDRVYLDLEADSMHHYFAKICLMQILADGVCYAVDPLADLDLKPLLSALARKPLVLHGATICACFTSNTGSGPARCSTP
jgi:ribonuclease D